MTNRERFIKTLKCEKIGGRVPTFELVFFLTMEAFGKIHPLQRTYDQWDQMEKTEQQLHIKDIASLYIKTAEKYGHSAIFMHPPVHPEKKIPEFIERIIHEIREQSGNEYFIMVHGDCTWSIPDGENMMDFAVQMCEEPEKLHEQSKRRLEEKLRFAEYMDKRGHLLDGFALCSDYCFNANPFFSQDMFDEHIAPYLKGVIDGYRQLGYYSIKHTDGNVMPILKQIADCKPDAIHSLDPQGGVNIKEVRKVVGDDICLIGNVNCGLLQTGSEEDCDRDVLRALQEGMQTGRGYIFSTSNCIYTGMPLSRYERMNALWKKYGIYQ